MLARIIKKLTIYIFVSRRNGNVQSESVKSHCTGTGLSTRSVTEVTLLIFVLTPLDKRQKLGERLFSYFLR